VQYAYWPHSAGQPPTTTTTKNCYKIWLIKIQYFKKKFPSLLGVKFRQNVENKKLKGIFCQNIHVLKKIFSEKIAKF
jgi:hypothetical protein